MRVAAKIAVGNRVVATEQFHLMGPAQGTWWEKYSWWVIPLGVILLILPAIGYWSGVKVFSLSNPNQITSTPTPIVVTPVVVQQPVPPPAPQTPAASGEVKEAGNEPATPKPKPKSLWDLNP